MNRLPRMNRAQELLFQDIRKFTKVHNRRHASREKEVSHATQETRFQHLVRSLVVELHGLGHRRTKLKCLKPRDIVALIQYWEPRIDGRTMRNRLSTLRWLCKKLNKPDIIPRDPRVHMKDPSKFDCPAAATEEITPESKAVDVEAFLRKVLEKDLLVFLVQLLKIEWGLRRREAVMTRPHEQDKGDYFLVARRRGPKGGRPRAIPHYNFTTELDEATGETVIVDPHLDPVKRELLELMKRFTNSRGSLIPDGYSLQRWMRWERYVVEEYGGLTMRKLGITSHKFRHAYAQARGELISGVTRRFRRSDELTAEEVRQDHLARKMVTGELGHRDPHTVSCYSGSPSQRAPRGFVKRVEQALTGRLVEPIIKRDGDGRLIGGSGMRIRIEYRDLPEPELTAEVLE